MAISTIVRGGEKLSHWLVSLLFRCVKSRRLCLRLALGLAGAFMTWRLRRRILAYTVTGPYDRVVGLVETLARALQRALIDRTREDVHVDWFPINGITDQHPRRHNDNGHPRSGAVRDAARIAIDQVVNASGRRRYEISPGGRSLDESGAHQHYAPGDLHTGVREDPIEKGDVVIGIDIDYYLSNVDKYLGNPVPAIFHTFVPMTVAGKDGEATFRIENNKVVYDVPGGNRWEHEVWNWTAAGEFIEFRAPGWKPWLLSFLGFEKIVYQKVHHARPWIDCPQRALVWLIPQYSCWRFSWLDNHIFARRLERMRFQDPTHPGWNILVHSVTEKTVGEYDVISLGREGEDAHVEIQKMHFDTLMALGSAQSVASRMVGMGYKEPMVQALVQQYYRKAPRENIDPERTLRSAGPRAHWPLTMEAEYPEISYRSYSSPLTSDPNMVPQIKRWEALSQSIERRVTDVANHKVPPAKYNRYANEFARVIVPVRGQVIPYCLEQTMEMLDKPSQQLGIKQILETVDMDPKRRWETFIKNEPCNKAPRMIAAAADFRFLLQYSSHTLAVRDAILHDERHQHWFCPGKTPVQIAETLQEFVSGIDTAIETDFSNLDGTVSVWMQRNIGQAIYLRATHPDYQKESQRLQDFEITAPARAKRFNFAYEPGVGVKSGSPTTCDKNTLYGEFVEFCALREVYPEREPEELLPLFGPKFGDDGVSDVRLKRKIMQVCEALGLTIKIEKPDPAQGICFLARVFPDIHKTLTSFQDPLRTWRKLHLTARDPNIPIADAATDRLEGYLVTDRLTPITSDYANAVIKYYSDSVSSKEIRDARKSRNKEKPYWCYGDAAIPEANAACAAHNASWPQDAADTELMIQCISARVGVDVEVLRERQRDLQNTTNIMALPVFDRSEEESPYKHTLDDDSQPDGEGVGIRNFDSDHNVQCLRSNPTIPERGERVNNGSQPGNRRPGEAPDQAGVQRHPELPQAFEEGGPRREGRRDQPAGETRRGRFPQRRAPANQGGGRRQNPGGNNPIAEEVRNAHRGRRRGTPPPRGRRGVWRGRGGGARAV